MTPRYARAPRGTRVYGAIPRNHGQDTTLGAARRPDGIGAAMTLEGASDGPACGAFGREFLAPPRRPGQIVVLDNRAVHTVAAARAPVESRGCRLRFLPAYSPDFSPIELAFAKLKEALHRAGARTKPTLETAIAAALDAIAAQDARGWFAACGYPPDG